MNKESIEKRKVELEAEFKKVEATRSQAQAVFNECTQAMMRLQGAHAELVKMEEELGKPKSK